MWGPSHIGTTGDSSREPGEKPPASEAVSAWLLRAPKSFPVHSQNDYFGSLLLCNKSPQNIIQQVIDFAYKSVIWAKLGKNHSSLLYDTWGPPGDDCGSRSQG